MTALIHAELTHSAIGAFYTVYNKLDHGFLEQLYCRALERELRKRGHDVAREVSVIVHYDGEAIGRQKLDMVVDGILVLEVKSTELLNKSALRQLKSYLHATRMEVGLLFHFGPDPKHYREVGRAISRTGKRSE